MTFQEEGREKLLLRRELYSELRLGRSDGGDEGIKPHFLQTLHEKVQRLWMRTKAMAFETYHMGRSDPRKVVFAVKMGLALCLISLFIFWKESLNSISENSIWAIMTVVVVFEFSIGATFNKGFNRALGTLSAGALSVGIGQMSNLTGVLAGAIIVLSIFIAGFAASYVKLYPAMKEYEYGFRVFLLTYCIVLNSGSSNFVNTALTRLLLIAAGAAVCLVVNTCIYPIWAGEDLHKSVVKNFIGVANSLDGCVNAYIECHDYVRVPSKILTFQASDDPLYSGYRSAVDSASKEDNLMEFATWEPPHGRYNRCKYPWNLFIKVSGTLRHCAFMVMAMHGCMLSEIQAPGELRQVFRKEIKEVGIEGAKVLRELGSKVEKMEKLSPGNTLLQDVHSAAERLQMAIDKKSYLLVKSASWVNKGQQKVIEDPGSFIDSKDHEEKPLGPNRVSAPSLRNMDPQQPNMPRYPSMLKSGSSEDVFRNQISWPRLSVESEILSNEREARTYESASALSLGTFAAMSIEFVARLQNLVDAFVELSEKANFKEPVVQTGCAEKETAAGLWTRLTCCF